MLRLGRTMRSKRERPGASQSTTSVPAPFVGKGETFYPQTQTAAQNQTPSAAYGSVDFSNFLPAYVHQSWTDVIPPNGVTGHPNLLVDGIDRGIARPFSAAVRIRKPTEAESLPTKTSSLSKGSSNGISSQAFKPSLQPMGLSKFVSEPARTSLQSFAYSPFTRLQLMSLSGKEAFPGPLRLLGLHQHLPTSPTAIIVISCHPV